MANWPRRVTTARTSNKGKPYADARQMFSTDTDDGPSADLSRLRLLIDGRFGDLGESFVGRFFLLQSLLEQ
jgi:hypothetical protein